MWMARTGTPANVTSRPQLTVATRGDRSGGAGSRRSSAGRCGAAVMPRRGRGVAEVVWRGRGVAGVVQRSVRGLAKQREGKGFRGSGGWERASWQGPGGS